MSDKNKNNFDSLTCRDILAFQEYLKNLRKVDDTIILNLNNVIASSQQQLENCKLFHSELREGHSTRDSVINTCLSDATSMLEELKSKSENGALTELGAQKEMRKHQNRLRMIQKEVSVEQIIQDRSLKALQERCRRFINFNT